MLDEITIFARLNSAIPFFNVLLKFLHCFTLVVIPIADVFPSFLERLPHPEAFEGREVRVREHVRRDQEQRPAAWTAPLLSVGKIPLAVGAFVTLRSNFQEATSPHPARYRKLSCRDVFPSVARR